jgi:3-deoxy-D-arabino-heptulosonate 7-phosphate (DAHP) synthase
MKFYAGPCLVNDNKNEIEDVWKTAEKLKKIDPNIGLRFKIWGGGTSPSNYVAGIGAEKGLKLLYDLKNAGYKVGTEIRDLDQLKTTNHYFKKFYEETGVKGKLDFIWIASRSSSNYHLIDNLTLFHQEIIVKRRMDMTIEEIWAVHDMIKHITKDNKNPVTICDRGIIDFTRASDSRWSPDFKGMLKTLSERKDIKLIFDPAHCVGKKDWIFPLVKAAASLGVKNFMFEVMNDPFLSQTDKAQILSVGEFEEIYNYIQKNQ